MRSDKSALLTDPGATRWVATLLPDQAIGTGGADPNLIVMGQLFVYDHPLVHHKITRLRDRDTRPWEFRNLVRELSLLLAVQATRDLATRRVQVETPMQAASGRVLNEHVAVVPILRAGLGMVEGVIDLLPQAEVWHLGLYRDEESLVPVEYYNKLPEGKPAQQALLLDPMLATGGSACAAVDVLKRWGPQHIKFVGLLGAPEGVQLLEETHPDVPIYLAALDERLNENGYILPGLGDAGDRQFQTGANRATLD